MRAFLSCQATSSQVPSSWSADEQLWVWDYTDEDRLFLDLDNPVRFRVHKVTYNRPSTSTRPATVKPNGQAAGGGGGGGAARPANAAGAAGAVGAEARPRSCQHRETRH